MSVDTPPEPEPIVTTPTGVLRREALLPTERNRGLGTVAVVCTMAGVASGLALATTLMAMQVADSMSMHSCPYRVVATDVQSFDHGFLGIRYTFHDGAAEIINVLPGTPAEAIELRSGDRVVAIDGAQVRSAEDVQGLNRMHPGSQPELVIERDGHSETVHPTLVAWPTVRY